MASNTLYNFDPEYIGELIAKANWEQCWEYLTGVLETLTMSAGNSAFSYILERDMQDEKKRQYVKDFGALLGELFLFLLTAEEVNLSDKSFHKLMTYYETLHSLFYIHDMDDTDEKVKELIGSGKKLPPKQQKKLLLLLSLNTNLDLNGILDSVERPYQIAAVVAYFGHRKIFKKNTYNNKVRLFELRSLLKRAFEPARMLTDLTHSYFLCSYLKIDHRHDIKKDINAAMRQYLSNSSREFRRIKNSPILPQYRHNFDNGKPVILVINEYFARNHAMYRGWGRLIKSLESQFNIVITVPTGPDLDTLKSEYEHIYTFDSVGQLYEIVHAFNPEIIFYPSIGMKFFNIALSNLRLAPIQIMGLGHPATSMSEYIDYVVSPKGLYDPSAFPQDTYIADGYPEKHTPLLSKAEFFAPLSPEEMPVREAGEKIIEVCVVGTDIKVSYPFFKLLKEIVDSSPFKIHVSFMMGVLGIDSLYIEKFLRENFKDCTYYGWQRYADYLKNIKKTDIVLNSFPFGHTNTIIDTLMCGKPCIGLEGSEPSSRTEGDVLNAAGLKDMFIAKSEEEYKEKFFAIAEKILNGQTEFFDRDKIFDRIFAELGDYDYGNVFRWIYDNHPQMKESDKKYFDVFSPLEN